MPIASSLLNKPRLVEKLRNFYDYVQKNDGKVGTKTRGIDLNFNNACNLRCKYCFTNSPKGDHVKEYLDEKKVGVHFIMSSAICFGKGGDYYKATEALSKSSNSPFIGQDLVGRVKYVISKNQFFTL